MSVLYEEQAQAVRTSASVLRSWAVELSSAAQRLTPALGWHGPAAESAAEAVAELRLRTHDVAARPDRAADALARCAAELEQAAALQRQADALEGPVSACLTEEACDLAQGALRRAAASLQDLCPAPPLQRHWLRGQAVGLGRGAWGALRGMFDLSQRMSPQRAVLDPRGALRDRLALTHQLLDDVRHPRDTVAALVGAEQLRDGAYGEWLGSLLAGAAIPGGRMGRLGRLDGLGARSVVRLVDKGGPVSVRIGLRLPRGYPVHIQNLKPERRRHILDGDATGGGHRAGTGLGKSEFPASWSDDEIIERVMKTAMRPEHVEVGQNGNLAAWAWQEGQPIKVVVNRHGHVITAHPDRGGLFARDAARIP